MSTITYALETKVRQATRAKYTNSTEYENLNYPWRLTFEVEAAANSQVRYTLDSDDRPIVEEPSTNPHADVIIRSWWPNGTINVESMSAASARVQWKQWVNKGYIRVNNQVAWQTRKNVLYLVGR